MRIFTVLFVAVILIASTTIYAQDYFEGCGMLYEDNEASCVLFRANNGATYYPDEIGVHDVGDEIFLVGYIELECEPCGALFLPCLVVNEIKDCDCCKGIRGNVDNNLNDQIDIVDLVVLVEFQFSVPAGPAPVCMKEADVDATGIVDMSDIVYLVDYQFYHSYTPPLCNISSLRLGTRVIITLDEIDNDNGNDLILHCRTELEYPCFNYSINYNSVIIQEGNLRFFAIYQIKFNKIITPDICLEAIGPATAIINLGNIDNGAHTLIFDNGFPVSSMLIVTEEMYKIQSWDSTQIDFENPILFR